MTLLPTVGSIGLPWGVDPGELLFALGLVAFVTFGFFYRMAFVSAMYSSDPTAHEEKVNCSACGARTATDPATCDYCEEPLPGGASPGSS